jgi:hypothetical protein
MAFVETDFNTGDDYSKSVRKIVKKVHFEIQRSQEPLEKIKIKQVAQWMVETAGKVGVNIEGYEHEISNYFIHHVIKNHANEKTEVIRGNLPITDEDFEQIPEIIEHPDWVIFGAKRNNEDRIVYVKHAENGTILYFEEILRGKRNRSLRGNTMYKTKKTLNIDGILANIRINGKTDLSKIKIADMDGD